MTYQQYDPQERLYNFYYQQYYQDLFRLLTGREKEVPYFHHNQGKETKIDRQTLADYIDEEKYLYRGQIMGATLDTECVLEARIVLMDAIDKLAQEGAERMVQYYLDHYMDEEEDIDGWKYELNAALEK